jgi:hypothetical protein
MGVTLYAITIQNTKLVGVKFNAISKVMLELYHYLYLFDTQANR